MSQETLELGEMLDNCKRLNVAKDLETFNKFAKASPAYFNRLLFLLLKKSLDERI